MRRVRLNRANVEPAWGTSNRECIDVALARWPRSETCQEKVRTQKKVSYAIPVPGALFRIPAALLRGGSSDGHFEVGPACCDVEVPGVEFGCSCIMDAGAWDVLEPEPTEDGKCSLQVRVIWLVLRQQGRGPPQSSRAQLPACLVCEAGGLTMPAHEGSPPQPP